MRGHQHGPTSDYSIGGKHATPGPEPSLAEQHLLPAQNGESVRIGEGLLALYGGGDSSHIRLMLFSRLEREVNRYGPPVQRIIVSAQRSAESANDPARYFCTTVTRRLKEAGFLQGG